MFYPSLGLAVAVAVLAGQAARTPATDNYNGLRKVVNAPAPRAALTVPQAASSATGAQAVDKHRGTERGPCGMPIIVADASVDSKIIVPIPDDARKNAKIRVAEPAPCGATLSNASRR
jgi:hypothetical protein